jgi:3-oxoacyl-[acyl-carrier-protein] synthase I
MATMQPLPISVFTATSCLGRGNASTWSALQARRGGLAPCAFMSLGLPTYVGQVAGIDDEPVRADLREYDCRNNRLAQIALRQDGFESAVQRAIDRHGADRVGLFLASSTSGLLQTELAYRQRTGSEAALPADFVYEATHNMYSLGGFVRAYFGLQGPASVLSAACASSAKVFASAARAIASGLVDAALVGGVDTLCLTTLYGFGSLQLLSSQPCRPFDVDRDGISIGEAAAFALLQRPGASATGDPPPAGYLAGYGESSDAYHMSSPHPEGAGAEQAMRRALASAGLEARQVDYINLHGTATPANDRAEGRAVHALFGAGTKCSSTKGVTGHTLGAAGITEAAISLLSLEQGFLPGSPTTREVDPETQCDFALRGEARALRRVLSNSFGFGGNNCALVFERAN